MKQHLRTENGLTLVEILVSLAIFGIMAVLFLSVFYNSFYITLRAEDRTQAVGKASGQIQSVLSSTKSTLTNSSVTLEYNDEVTNIVPGETTSRSIITENNQTIELEYFIPKE